MVNDLKLECSFSSWYPTFKKDSLEARILRIPDEVLKYLEHDTFILPLEATGSFPDSSEWADGSPVTREEEETDCQPTFPEFSRQIQEILDEYDAVFVKTNWSTPADAMWVAPTKTLKCNTLEEVYLLLKSSDRIAKDLNVVKSMGDSENPLPFCLVLKQWRDINPCAEFRCFVVDNKLTAISQRDISQYHSSNESEKYDIQTDIKSLFSERIRGRFPLRNYSFDVVRRKKDKVKIIDFGALDAASTEGTLFTYEELQCRIENTPEFRFIGEEIGIQPKPPVQFCIPQEISEFFQSRENVTLLDIIQREVENQRREHEKENANVSEST
ncbi:PREDICTED: cell division cycle protein 123 homolog [Vollenhovia emeryi]|uniref:cell division cycle protein 123 homolog n=1 Tax=Vollenhovia emeryi TaxID=411798 RepID=UPI0005F40B68|nr:PREDICTED: cell division cycle protein 123 homolog [Vollenhovia emeryi]XP_011876157.1 PREDICTED: cell division cycle protein 123 homolog [Vollenhovia emeryi]XP_011876158.1 PREDICTED: cell division cycle protein 123 homolog [Vollenhovia emeryi]XP_011876159.1 PREDICTED: cell division cycle protein 123 homolog [Vollenhovia emeryi]